MTSIIDGKFKIKPRLETEEYVSDILAKMPDQSHANLLRDLIFRGLSEYAWRAATERIHHWCPETKPE